MPYEISGTLTDAARIYVIKESDHTIEKTEEKASGSYSIAGLVSGQKFVAARKSDGEGLAYGNVTPESVSGDVAVFGGAWISLNNIDYITISSTGDATDFGDLVSTRSWLSATSNA